MKKSSLYQATCNTVAWLLRPLTLPIDVMLHTSVGERHAGFGMVPALGVPIAWALAFPESQTTLFIFAGVLFLRMLSCNASGQGLFDGEMLHTRYPGRPLFGLWRDRFSPESIRDAEVLLILLLGWVVSLMSPPLGLYMLCTGVASLFAMGLKKAVVRDKMLDRRDAEIDQVTEQLESRKIRQELGLPVPVMVHSERFEAFESFPSGRDLPMLEAASQAVA